MTSIPADPSMVLGNYVEPERILHLLKIARALAPEELANDKLQQLILTNYRFKMIKGNLANINAPEDALTKLETKMVELRFKMAEAACDLAIKSMECQDAVEALETEFGQTTISSKPESPLDYGNIAVKKFPLASDTMKFDVQFFKMNKNEEDSDTHATSIASYVKGAGQDGENANFSSGGIGDSVETLVSNQTSKHVIDGTIVITANCNHRMADIIAPVTMDPMKLLTAWNDQFGKDYLDTDPQAMFDCALEKTEGNKENKLHLLTGCTRGSSFVGMVHILQTEETSSESESEAKAEQLASILASNQAMEAEMGNFGVGSNFAKEAAELLSSSEITSHCTLCTRGVIPDISANTMKSSILSLNPNPQQIMERLSVMTEAANAPLKPSQEGSAEQARTQQQTKRAGREYIQQMGQELSNHDDEVNQVFDTQTLMTAFTNYVKKCEEGGVGVPVNFYLKEIDKCMVAREYIKKFYPNGAQTQANLRSGILGQAPAAAS
mmetsp:Transcript_24973/g.28465  ORF Transcript_24973/g.28465 Transcript_24973/m.28465 type:complete len:497 (+) Transcript_24973:257-1747(+)|eukprot:CAMPEP_0194135938 /NCGR_PEP_ID=MMETSP0152-20130528/5992_1 /TAXON_ID=1049557 /ORGANISM="Thalassiothrix antarctica, Strain L6-D1" /LENGTH=496 /DNA_ID=CAMNT_0038832399 /DNA_START=198 /DNA_END=1688 /DNA_ORIENTATION=-